MKKNLPQDKKVTIENVIKTLVERDELLERNPLSYLLVFNFFILPSLSLLSRTTHTHTLARAHPSTTSGTALE